MSEVLQIIDWQQLIGSLWTAILLPLLTYAGIELRNYAKTRQLDKYTDILYRNVVDAVKDVYEVVVKDVKGTELWNEEKQKEVKELAKAKAVSALTNSAYQALKLANSDFEEYLDGLIGTALYDLKHT